MNSNKNIEDVLDERPEPQKHKEERNEQELVVNGVQGKPKLIRPSVQGSVL